jgi:hypothetical protein
VGCVGCTSSSSAAVPCATGICLDVSVPSTCDPTLMCAQVNTCEDGQLYPSACGPKNCDEPLGPCIAVDGGDGGGGVDAKAPRDAEKDGRTDAAHDSGSNLDARAPGDL